MMTTKENYDPQLKSPPKPAKSCSFALSEPMLHPQFSNSPLLTLKESLLPPDEQDITSHDLVEAYNIISCRIRASGAGIDASGIDALRRCLTRDIQAHDTTLQVYARGLLSQIFAFPKLHSLFSFQSLSTMLSNLLSTFATPRSPKIYFLTTHLLRAQQLPTQVLNAQLIPLIKSFKHVIQNNEPDIVIDGFIGLESLLRKGPGIFLPTIIDEDLFTVIMNKFIALPTTQRHAVSLISAFAFAKIQTRLSVTLCNQLSSQILNFMELALSHRSQSSLWSQLTFAASSLLSHDQALVLVASLIIIHDAPLFSHPLSLRFYMKSHGQAFSTSRAQTRQLTANCWKCLLWAYARMPEDDPKKDQAFQVVLEDVRKGIGTAAVWITMCSGDGGQHERALVAVMRMVSSKNEATVLEGLRVLQMLAGQGGAAPSLHLSNENEVLYTGFFDKTVLSGSGSMGLEKDLMTEIPQLSSEQLLGCWKEVLTAWETAIRSNADASKAANLSFYQNNIQILTHIFQSLVLVQSDLTQRTFGHLTMSTHIFEVVGEVISALLDMDVMLVDRFWGVITRVFERPHLDIIANKIFCRILKVDGDAAYDVDPRSKHWQSLVTNLVPAVQLDIVIQFLQDDSLKIDAKKLIWEILITAIPFDTSAKQESNFMTLLLIPFRWRMDAKDSEVWATVLGQITKHLPSKVCFIEALVRDLGEKRAAILSLYPKVLQALISAAVPASSASELPSWSFFAVLSAAVTYLYPPNPQFPSILAVLDIFAEIKNLIRASETIVMLDLLGQLSACLEIWISDKQQCISVEQYNSVLIPLYETILDRLSYLPPSHTLISTMSPVLCSVFERMPEPYTGPTLFVEYWEGCWKGKEREYVRSFPSYLKDCLETVCEWKIDSEDVSVGDEEILPDSQGDPNLSSFGSMILPGYANYASPPLVDHAMAKKHQRVENDTGGGSSSCKRRRINSIPFQDSDITLALAALIRRGGAESSLPKTLDHKYDSDSDDTPKPTPQSLLRETGYDFLTDCDTWDLGVPSSDDRRIRRDLNQEGFDNIAFMSPDDDDEEDLGGGAGQDILASPFVTRGSGGDASALASQSTPSPSVRAQQSLKSKKPSAPWSTRLAALRQARQKFDISMDEDESTINSQELEEAQTLLKEIESKIMRVRKGKRPIRGK